ncbi:MAG: hypothetical protein HQK91_03470 [Nitrospirae bacterium]|nr:hypothetical protein [Nitrospirota bacterium]
MDQNLIKSMVDLFNNPIFQKCSMDFFSKMQDGGLDDAKKYWSLSPHKNQFFDGSTDMMEQFSKFYATMGFVPSWKYDKLKEENEKLQKENQFLKDTISQLNLKVFEEGSKKIQDVWTSTIEAQMSIGKELAQNFLGMVKNKEDK